MSSVYTGALAPHRIGFTASLSFPRCLEIHKVYSSSFYSLNRGGGEPEQLCDDLL